MKDQPFIHLRVHSAYSLAEGAIKVPELPKLCQKHHMPAIGITDTANLFGALEIAMACAKEGIQPIIGCQINLRRWGEEKQADPLVLIVQSEEGYHNLLKLVTHSYLKTGKEPSEKPTVEWEQLTLHASGLIALTGGPMGSLGIFLNQGRADKAEALLKEFQVLFSDRLYIELMRHGLPGEMAIEESFLDLAYKYHVPLVATNDVYYATPDLYHAHDALLCIAQGAYLYDDKRRRVTDQHYFKSTQEMQETFADLPEALSNTRIIAQRCHFMPQSRQPLLPSYPTLHGEVEELKHQAREGLKTRLESLENKEGKDMQPYWQRLDYELEIIEQMGFPGYFLIVADFIQWAKKNSIPVGPGRGSGAGSLVAWALTITDLDPIRFNLLFERFLNPERVSLPDFDVDFCQDRRDEVIDYVCQRYGKDRVAHIITFGKLQARAVLRDVGRVLQMPYGQVDKICKLVPNHPTNPVTLAQAIEREPLLQEAQRQDEMVQRLMDIGMKLEGLYRHASTHAAGLVIGDRSLENLIPLYRDERSNLPVTQFNMKYVEMAGLLKFDFLGLKTLTVIEQCCQMVRDSGTPLDIGKIPLDDPKTFELLCRVDTVGVFQLEGAGMRDVLRKLQPDRFEDIIALVALYRPGPMDDIPRYLACKHGEEKVSYIHPSLEPILQATYGVMVYQEQVMQIAQTLGGYSLGAADLLRRAMGKKIKAEMDAQRALFTQGAVERGIEVGVAHQIFDQMAKFAGYGFNKSHSAPYALIAYQTAYLKANYPCEFMAASMTHDIHNTDKLAVFYRDLCRQGIPLLPPDINQSDVFFKREGQWVRYGLAAIKNVGTQAMAEIVKERQKYGHFKDLSDFISRLNPRALNRRQFEKLIEAGAFDEIYPHRRHLFEEADTLLNHAQRAWADRTSSQVSLFEGVGSPSAQATLFRQRSGEEWGPLEKLNHEREALGFFLSSHPLDLYQNVLKKWGVVSVDQLPKEGGEAVFIAGILLSKQERRSKKGQPFAFVQLTDTSGLFEVAIFPEVYAKARSYLAVGTPFLMQATYRQEGEEKRFTAQDIKLLDTLLEVKNLTLKIKEGFPFPLLKETLGDNQEGATHIRMLLQLDEEAEMEVWLPGRYTLTADKWGKLMSLKGVEILETRA